EFLGRLDDQIKFRGFRIEPGEIEAALGEHPHVRESIASTHEDGSGELELMAFVVCNDGHLPASADLRQFLADRIPDYMVPSNFIFLDTLPLLPSGKVNRRGLPMTFEQNLQAETEQPRAVTATEGILCEIWAEVIGLKEVGV